MAETGCAQEETLRIGLADAYLFGGHHTLGHGQPRSAQPGFSQWPRAGGDYGPLACGDGCQQRGGAWDFNDTFRVFGFRDIVANGLGLSIKMGRKHPDSFRRAAAVRDGEDAIELDIVALRKQTPVVDHGSSRIHQSSIEIEEDCSAVEGHVVGKEETSPVSGRMGCRRSPQRDLNRRYPCTCGGNRIRLLNQFLDVHQVQRRLAVAVTLEDDLLAVGSENRCDVVRV